MRLTTHTLQLLLLVTCALAFTLTGCQTNVTASSPNDGELPTDTARDRPENGIPEPDGAPPLSPNTEAARSAIHRALPVIASEGWAWMRGEVGIQGGRACVSCHHVNYAVWSLNEARRIGLETPAGELDALISKAVEFMARPDKARSMSIGPMLLGLELEQAPEDLVERLVDLQTSSGRWRARGQFPDQRRPIEESDAVATLWSLLVLPADSLRTTEATKAALGWLLSEEEGSTNEWLAGQMLLADHLDRSKERDRARAELRAAQNKDGGWGWRQGEASNAFSTGQALYAFARIGDFGHDDARRYLVETQDADGSWLVPSGAISRHPTAERDQIYRFWGTAWATIGLSRSATSTTRPTQLAFHRSRP